MTRLFDRYELPDGAPHVAGGRLYRARDLAFAETVGVKQLGAHCGLSFPARQFVENFVRHLQRLPHPNLVRLYSFDSAAGILVQEWIAGISLLDLLRRRRELRANETFTLLSDLPATLDLLAREGLFTAAPMLGRLFMQFESLPPEELATTPVDRWPPFTLKFNALSMHRLIEDAADENETQIVSTRPRGVAGNLAKESAREFARLLYELLGGRIRGLDAGRYSPLGALRESGNNVLRRALQEGASADCQTLWSELLRVQPELNRPAPTAAAGSFAGNRPLRIPAPLVEKSEPATVLSLEPTDTHSTPIRLVVGPRFEIGRSPQQADFVARVLPENAANSALTNRLSRVHCCLELGPDGLLLVRDGNGKLASVNGTFLNDLALAPDPATPLVHRSILRLGQEYALELIPVFQFFRRKLPIGNIGAWSGPEETPAASPYGAIVCLPADGHPAIRQSAWLFSEVGFGLDAAERLVWDTRGRSESPAAFHHHRGCFWLRNRSLPETALACDGTALVRDEIAPLAAGQSIRMGGRKFTVRLG